MDKEEKVLIDKGSIEEFASVVRTLRFTPKSYILLVENEKELNHILKTVGIFYHRLRFDWGLLEDLRVKSRRKGVEEIHRLQGQYPINLYNLALSKIAKNPNVFSKQTPPRIVREVEEQILSLHDPTLRIFDWINQVD